MEERARGGRGRRGKSCVDTQGNNNFNRRRACQKTRSQIILVIEKLRKRGCLRPKVSLRKMRIKSKKTKKNKRGGSGTGMEVGR